MDQNQLREWESRCIQEEAPECTAACPLHVDARLFLKEADRGEWDAAFQVLAKTMPFPGILGRICDRPCESRCKRGQVDEPLAVGLIERHCVERGGKVRIQPLPRRPQRVAVAGGGLAGLTAAWDLLKKGFAVTILEPGERLGGALWDLPENLLPREVLLAELELMERLKCEVRLGESLDRERFDGLIDEFDALFLDRELEEAEGLLAWKQEGSCLVDAATGATARAGVFAGGGSGRGGLFSPVHEALQGRKGALSIERFLQNVQLGTGRENEGPYPSRLHTRLKGIETAPRVRPAQAERGYDEAEARREAGRCLQCECMECVKSCLYLERYQGYPKKYARQIFNNERVIFGAARSKNQFVNSCSNCGLCKTVCPNDFHMGELCLDARRTMREQKLMPASFHEFALNDMAHSRGEAFSLVRHAPGREKSSWLYFPSCQLSATSPGEVLASYRYLQERLAGGVAVMLGCCGAPAYWAGDEALFQESLQALAEGWKALGSPRVITACTSCQGILNRHLPEMTVVSLWQLMDDAELPLPRVGTDSKISIADPCASREFPDLQLSVRRLAGRLGFEVDELPLSGEMAECCGYGGLVFNANPKLAREEVELRTGESVRPAAANVEPSPRPGLQREPARGERATTYYEPSASGHDYLAYCAMCRDNLAGTGKRVSHLIEHLFPTVDGGDPAGRGWISWSERRANRVRVKTGMLDDLGESEQQEVAAHEAIRLQIAPEVLRTIDDRRILEEELKKVIHHAEQSGRRLQNRESGVYRGYLTSENVTFWVDYAPAGEGFTVYNAYSHRMKIVGVKG